MFNIIIFNKVLGKQCFPGCKVLPCSPEEGVKSHIGVEAMLGFTTEVGPGSLEETVTEIIINKFPKNISMCIE